jgi:UDP-N-acetylglucosamine:LPS N-acetylglucosamine transferase
VGAAFSRDEDFSVLVADRFQHDKRIAYFISAHGFGHATRAAAVMEAIAASDASIQFEIFTTVPPWLFEDSLGAPATYHALQTDIGLVQTSAFQVDLGATLQHLDRFYPVEQRRLEELSRQIKQLNCALVVCDIAPLGILVAAQAGIPSVLVENFTWDWIYQQYATAEARILSHIHYLEPIFAGADYHIQTEPVCDARSADLITAPVARRVRTNGQPLKQRFGLSAGAKMVLITTGGIPGSYTFFKKLAAVPEVTFIIPGIGRELQIRDNLVLLPHRSDFYHPDLVNAADAVIGKLGYSTLAEVYHAGVPFGYIPRSNFRESGRMVEFIESEMCALAVAESEFQEGSWVAKLDILFAFARCRRHGCNGADQAGRFIADLVA